VYATDEGGNQDEALVMIIIEDENDNHPVYDSMDQVLNVRYYFLIGTKCCIRERTKLI
jgi:hypothetical protein